MTRSDPLPQHYYLQYFRCVLEQVCRNYAWLDSDERGFAEDFLALATPAQALLARLYQRRSALIKQHQLGWPDLEVTPDLLQSLHPLWIDLQPEPDLDELLALCTLGDLRHLGCTGRSRHEVLADAHARHTDPRKLQNRLPWPLLRVLHRDHVQVFQDLFFGNRHQNLGQFVAEALGHVRYPVAAEHCNGCWFDTRADYEAFVQIEAHDQVPAPRDTEGCLQSSAGLPHLPADHPLRPRIDRRRVRLARQLERLGCITEAENLYRSCAHPPARERLARLLHRSGKTASALTLCAEIRAAPRDESERIFAQRFQPGSPRKRTREDWPTQTIQMDAAPGAGPEQKVLQRLQVEGWQGLHCENWLFSSLFGLLAWDLLYEAVPGMFCQPFQLQPRDLGHSDFLHRRPGTHHAFLALLQDRASIRQTVESAWDRHFGTRNRFVGWYPQGLPWLQRALEAFHPEPLRELLLHFLEQPLERCKGLPDLFCLHHEHGPALIEVKGPGDQLRPHQRHWLAWLNQHGFNARVARVKHA